MAYSHVAHDCILGNKIIMSNVSQIAGHVNIEDWVILGAYSESTSILYYWNALYAGC